MMNRETNALLKAKNLFGHEQAQQWVDNLIKKRRLPHALLLSGPEGIGKASFAHHLAWQLLATGDKEENQALWQQLQENSCRNFLAVLDTAATSKKGIGVNDIQKITNFLNYTALDANWRIVLIDSVDALNKNAANALLKTLEEPPKNTLFLLISHYPGRLLATLRSRAVNLPLFPLSEKQLLKALENACGDQIDAANAEIRKILYNAKGSVAVALFWLNPENRAVFAMLNALLEKKEFDLVMAEKLASLCQEKEPYFIQELLNTLAQRVKEAVHKSQHGDAFMLAKNWKDMEAHLREAETYNLDKKQSLFLALQKLHGILHRTNKETF